MPLLDCSYRNALERMVIVRCFASGGFYLERVVFPFEILNFQAPRQAEVEVWSHGLGSPELVSTLTIEELICSESAMSPPLELING
ncbi:MAG: DUF1830 domain-containing protein [Synechococcus sp. MED-G71]|nr:MAG: DUF1830 domain-containing protein [Synechococcus sp. MED-G71]|tara:strand:+ start:4009 stop:4266 length:258 start_codon:yes stop_codon:yes gene_type:complete